MIWARVDGHSRIRNWIWVPSQPLPSLQSNKQNSKTKICSVRRSLMKSLWNLSFQSGRRRKGGALSRSYDCKPPKSKASVDDRSRKSPLLLPHFLSTVRSSTMALKAEEGHKRGLISWYVCSAMGYGHEIKQDVSRSHRGLFLYPAAKRKRKAGGSLKKLLKYQP